MPDFDTFAAAVAERLNLDAEKIQPQALWVGDVGVSSVDIVKVVMLIRQKFGVKIPTTAAGKIKTVDDAYQLLQGASA
ncbi:acyl carrier protein [Tumebacillus sp. ITR2]|jgi:acyl carrier protein|uniref:Acyl carrier protein n=1 Tax=Tumebacillus amylolyticus TaxID=2801339 RepID=A0ABS1JBG6_9BACL|nr:acyl carrier protein [Tumebacillus amylolyticus]MBL0387616.1 acyl carrier protein [Tumebacillus amylolyticus]